MPQFKVTMSVVAAKPAKKKPQKKQDLRCFTFAGWFINNNRKARATVMPDERVMPRNNPRELGWTRP